MESGLDYTILRPGGLNRDAASGTGVMTEEQRTQLRRSLRQTLNGIPAGDEFAPRLDRLIAQMDEVVTGKGDCVVAVSRGQLEGVQDTLTLPFDHLRITHPTGSRVERSLEQVVLERIR